MSKLLTDRSWYGVTKNELNKSILQEHKNFYNSPFASPPTESIKSSRKKAVPMYQERLFTQRALEESERKPVKRDANVSVLNSNMTADAPPLKPGKRPLSSARVNMGVFYPERKHYAVHRPNPVLYGGITSGTRVRQKLDANQWKPSADLVEFNRKRLRCYVGSQRVKKEVSGKSANRSSIINMAGVDASESLQSTRRLQPSEVEMKRIINYENGPAFRERRIAEKVCKADMANRARTPIAIRNYQIQSAEYHLNRLNSRGSKIVLS